MSTTSGTYNFSPSLGELVLYAYYLIGVRSTALTQQHMEVARMAANIVCADFSNKGVNLWQVQFITVPLVQGQATYSVNANTVTMLDAYISTTTGTSTVDRIIMPISRTEYASYPNKAQQGYPTVFWNDRLLSPTVTLWPVPDGTQTSLNYYSIVQLQDAVLTDGQAPDIPYLWLKAFVYALATEFAFIWEIDRVAVLTPIAGAAYEAAATTNVETSQFFISPMISSYFRS